MGGWHDVFKIIRMRKSGKAPATDRSFIIHSRFHLKQRRQVREKHSCKCIREKKRNSERIPLVWKIFYPVIYISQTSDSSLTGYFEVVSSRWSRTKSFPWDWAVQRSAAWYKLQDKIQSLTGYNRQCEPLILSFWPSIRWRHFSSDCKDFGCC